MSEVISKRTIIFIVSLALSMESVDATIINTAIPAIAESLHVPTLDLKITLISYLLSLAIFIPISGWLADKYGSKRIFITALVIFTLSSLWCGFASDLTGLVIGRFIQGIGGAMMLPVARLILVRTVDRHELINAMSRIVIVSSMALMLGPVLGGFITHYFSWHWIFWVNIPMGLFAIIVAWKGLQKNITYKVAPLDKVGFVLFGIGLGALTFGLSSFSESAIPDRYSLEILGLSVIFLLAYVWHSYYQKNPIIKTQLFKIRTFQVSTAGNLLGRLGFGGVPFLIPLLLQVGLGYSAPVSGLLLAPMAVGVLIVKILTMRVLRYFGFKKLLIMNTFLVGLGLWSFLLVHANTPIYVVAILTFIFGILIALQFSGMNSLAYSDVNPEDLSNATSIMSTLQQLAQSFGVAASALFIRLFSPGDKVLLSIATIHYSLFAMGVVTFFSIFIFIRLKPSDGAQMIRIN